MSFIDGLALSKPLDLQIEGEGNPKIIRPSEKGWSGITLPWMAYGYGFEITPLHTLALYNAVANDGKMINPMFVTAISRADRVTTTFDTEVIASKICSSKTLRQLKQLLEGVVQQGTATNLKDSDYRCY